VSKGFSLRGFGNKHRQIKSEAIMELKTSVELNSNKIGESTHPNFQDKTFNL
jgi:hypothetical protein